ncbi:efflux transporter outer membrane subunit [Sphingomonas oligoaromativorans]|uniref:efflux transporter outer membrane subunit n=1 Tax=Sphingomonas oligoaromativorans TaxID=575322 RepID=UPI00141FFB37|nr:efflux transporter outer membrane subunit [Sphingomonas oligoaromativorans]NIJ34118.1 NodT family efflux transporter outer membrane factor (OMF) lipoprotein [Sphingomonas oligoaromativorans]
MITNRRLNRLAGMSVMLIPLALSACMVGPNYEKPATALAPFHNAVPASATPAATAPLALDSWWTAFHDPMLATVVQRALDQNLDLAAAYARVQQARAVAKGAGAQLLPTIDVGGSATANRASLQTPITSLSSQVPGFRRNYEEYSVGPSASWEIDLFGGLRRGARAASDEESAAEADRVGTRITVVADAADAYLQIRGYQARLAVALDQVANDERLLKLVRDRYAAGSGNGQEIAEAEALLRQARSSIPTLRIGLEVQLNRLDVLMGAQPGTYAQELSTVQSIPGIPAIPSDRQPTDMLRRRPDIIAAERRLAASNERIGAAISDYYPKISLSGALGFDSISASNLFTKGAFAATGGGLIRWRLFDFGKVDAEVKQARGANAEALAVYRQTVLHAAEDVENALVTLSQTQVRVSEVQAQVAALTKARDLAQQSYKAGSIPLTDVINADQQLLVARDVLDSERAGTARSAVAVFRAFGGGWSPPTRQAEADVPTLMAKSGG